MDLHSDSHVNADSPAAALPRDATPALRGSIVGFGALSAIVLGAVTWWGHGDSLFDGPVLDDHCHQKALRELGWSYRDLMRAQVIDPAEFLSMWWQDQPVRFEYGRPFFIVAMKWLYDTLGGFDPMPLHAAAILLHFATVCMTARLAWLLTRDRLWSLLAGVFMALYPHASMTVAWSSSLNIVLATAFMLAAMLLYVRATGLELRPLRADEPRPREAAPDFRGVPFAVAMPLWIAALLTRENCLMMPAVLAGFEVAFGGWRWLWRRRWAYAAMAAIGAAFVVWRALAVPGPGMPDVYLLRPGDDRPAYALWALAKFFHYYCASVWPAPMIVGPTGRYAPWTDAPFDTWLTVGIVVASLAAFAAATRDRRGWWLWPIWVALAVLPVVPVIAAPHSGYLSGVGFAVGAALAGAARPWSRRGWLRQAAHAALLAHLVAFVALTVLNRWQWVSIAWAEKYAAERVASSAPPAEATDVYFLNLPLVNVYLKQVLDERLGAQFAPVRCHALSFAPDPFLVSDPILVEQLDAHSFRVSTTGQPWFSRLLGRLALQGFRSAGRLRSGEFIETPTFSVRVDQADAEGVRAMTFRFVSPLDDERQCFYVFTPNCYATRLRFGPPAAADATDEATPLAPSRKGVEHAAQRVRGGSSIAAEVLFAAIEVGAPHVSAAAAAELRPIAAYVARATAAPVQAMIDADATSPVNWAEVRRWWRGRVTDTVLQETWGWRARCREYDELMEEIPNARKHAARLIRSDLYLTGPPFPGPR